MEISYLFGLTSGLGYAVAAIFSKRALQLDCGVLRLSFIINWVFVAVFACLLAGDSFRIPEAALLWQPAATGGLFFLGQVFTFAAIRMGDVSLQTPIMGMKAVFVVMLASLLGTEPVTRELWGAAVLAAASIGLLGFSGGEFDKVGRTVVLAVLSCLFFAGSDTMVGQYGSGFGTATFLFLAILVNALLSFTLIPFFREPLGSMSRPALGWSFVAAVFMGLQALLLNYTLSQYQNVAAVNVLYAARGLWSVLLAAPLAVALAIPAEALTGRMKAQRIAGALLMCVAIAVVLS